MHDFGEFPRRLQAPGSLDSAWRVYDLLSPVAVHLLLAYVLAQHQGGDGG